jgi:hypothetical protein
MEAKKVLMCNITCLSNNMQLCLLYGGRANENVAWNVYQKGAVVTDF